MRSLRPDHDDQWPPFWWEYLPSQKLSTNLISYSSYATMYTINNIGLCINWHNQCSIDLCSLCESYLQVRAVLKKLLLLFLLSGISSHVSVSLTLEEKCLGALLENFKILPWWHFWKLNKICHSVLPVQSQPKTKVLNCMYMKVYVLLSNP